MRNLVDSGTLTKAKTSKLIPLNIRDVLNKKFRSVLIKCIMKGVITTTKPSRNMNIPEILHSLPGKNSIK